MHKQNQNPNKFCLGDHKISKQLYVDTPSPPKVFLCKQHKKTVGEYFCNQCLSYSICQGCLADHLDHSIDRFRDIDQAKECTKETLLLQVEQTLNRLKGRQNQLKNQVQEISLIKDKVRQQVSDIINCLRSQFDLLEKKVAEKLDIQFERYERDLDNFYREYNNVNDYLRQNLLQIIDGEINTFEFSRSNICKDIDVKLMPNFGKVKQAMQKCKKYLKNVKSSVGYLENSIKYFSNEEERSQAKYDKYDKFFRERATSESDYNSPLLRTLDILQSANDLSFLKAKLRS